MSDLSYSVHNTTIGVLAYKSFALRLKYRRQNRLLIRYQLVSGTMVRILKFAKSHVIIFIVVTYLAIQKSYKKVPMLRIDRFVADMKHILLLKKIYGLDGEGQTYFIDRKCTYINCYFSTNRSLLGDVRYFDVVLFNLQDVSEGNILLPDLRSSSQKYVFVANDSSDNFPVCNPIYDDFFNWTWTYR